MSFDLRSVRSALFLPASNPRAVARAREAGADLVILDLEDAVKVAEKDFARQAVVEALAEPWAVPVAVRLNAAASEWYEADVEAVCLASPDAVVLPKVEEPMLVERVAQRIGFPVLAMIETPAGVLAAPAIARAAGLTGLIAGTNDLAASLNVPAESRRSSMSVALQTIVLAARAAGVAAIDGVYNRLDDSEGLEHECREGRRLGFDGKSLIHPGQIEACNRAFSPSDEQIERAKRLIEAFDGGAQRFEDEMIEAMHIDEARRVLDRAARV
ncbi:MAG TPA: CoA ester lyase [Sphingomicrobium sp.]|nr:CoA ester lyase [Sphingomicrobium sp.]